MTLDDNDAELFWTIYNSKARVHHKDMFEGTSNNLDALLTFAGLFSAVVVGLIAITLGLLSPRTPSNGSPQVHTSPEDTVVNTLFVASLSCSVIAAFGAMAGKQVISHAFGPHNKGSPKRSALAHQRALVGGTRWRFKDTLEALPVLLQGSILLFFIGITLYLWNRSRAIAVVTLAIGCLGTLGYILLFQFATASFNPAGPWLIKGFRFGTRCVAMVSSLWGHGPNMVYARLRTVLLLIVYCVLIIGTISGVVIFILVGTGTGSVKSMFVALMVFFTVVLPVVFFRISTHTRESAPAPTPTLAPAPTPASNKLHAPVYTQVALSEAKRRRLREARDEFRCVQWALEEVSDERIVLEASRLIPYVLELDHIRELSHHPLAVDRLLTHFLDSIISESNKPRDALAVYSAAVCHILLSLAPNQLNRRALTSVFRELCRDKMAALPERLSLFANILAIECGLGGSDPNFPTTNAPRDISLNPDLFNHGTESYKSNLPFIYLSLSLSNEVSDEDTVIDFVTKCAQKLPLKQAVSLRIWFLSDGYKEPIQGINSEALKNRWRAYTASLSISDELQLILNRVQFDPSRFMSWRRSELLLKTLDDITQLEVDDLGMEDGPQKLLLALIYSIDHSFEWVKEEIFVNRPILLVRLASHDKVDNSTREKSLLKAQSYLTSWITSTDAPVGTWRALAEGLVRCDKGLLHHPKENDKLMVFLYEVAKEAVKKEGLAIALLDAFRRVMGPVAQKHLLHPPQDDKDPKPFRVDQHLLRRVVLVTWMYRLRSWFPWSSRFPLTREYSNVFAPLAVWGGICAGLGDLGETNNTDSQTLDAMRKWITKPFLNLIADLFVMLSPTYIDQLPVPVQRGLASFAKFLDGEVERGHWTGAQAEVFHAECTLVSVRDGEGRTENIPLEEV